MSKKELIDQIRLYDRTAGVVCFHALIIPYDRSRSVLEAFTDLLMAVGLDWLWTSDGTHLSGTVTVPDLALPRQRPLTMLRPDTREQFVRDLMECDDDERRRFLNLFGLEAGQSNSLVDEHQLRLTLREFTTGERGPIGLVLIQIDDTDREYLFVPHKPSEPVRRLMREWNVAREGVDEVMKYKHLNMVALEHMFRLDEF